MSKTPHQKVLLATAQVRVKSKNGELMVFRAMIDQGSQSTAISEEAAQMLQLSRIKTNVTLHGLGDTIVGVAKSKALLEIFPRCHINNKFNATALILPSLATTHIAQSFKYNEKDWKDYILADPNFNKSGKIDLIIGADLYGDIMEQKICKKGRILGQNTKLGWILSGMIHVHQATKRIMSAVTTNIERFWETERKAKELEALSLQGMDDEEEDEESNEVEAMENKKEEIIPEPPQQNQTNNAVETKTEGKTENVEIAEQQTPPARKSDGKEASLNGLQDLEEVIPDENSTNNTAEPRKKGFGLHYSPEPNLLQYQSDDDNNQEDDKYEDDSILEEYVEEEEENDAKNNKQQVRSKQQYAEKLKVVKSNNHFIPRASPHFGGVLEAATNCLNSIFKSFNICNKIRPRHQYLGKKNNSYQINFIGQQQKLIPVIKRKQHMSRELGREEEAERKRKRKRDKSLYPESTIIKWVRHSVRNYYAGHETEEDEEFNYTACFKSSCNNNLIFPPAECSNYLNMHNF